MVGIGEDIFTWGLSKDEERAELDAMWSRSFAALLEYYNQYDTCNVPANKTFKCDLVGMAADGGVYHYDGNLGRWLTTQRTNKRENKLRADREARLQALFDQGK